jgi:hypothetical protein
MIITRGFGPNQLIIVRGFGISEAVAEVITPSVPIILPALYKGQRYLPFIDLREEFLDFLTRTYDEIDLRAEVLELMVDEIDEINLRKELQEFSKTSTKTRGSKQT